ncbi:hypothetical protein PI125_g27166 [Phytophthora idaei]|nr:hypothetical protein PI125_g27166 [Phytophthora idaei]
MQEYMASTERKQSEAVERLEKEVESKIAEVAYTEASCHQARTIDSRRVAGCPTSSAGGRSREKSTRGCSAS